MTTANHYVTSRSLASYRSELDDLDRSILVALHRLSVATTEQLRRFLAPSVHPRAWQRRMSRLTRSRAVTRLTRRVGGVLAGSAPWPYVLDVAGMRAIGLPKARRPTTPTQAYLRHALTTTETIVLAGEAVRSMEGSSLRTFATEPRCWQPLARGGHLKPDAEIVIATPDYEDHYWIECDMATQSLTTIAAKLDRYRSHWASGYAQEHRGVFPRVVFVTLTEKRAVQIRRAIQRQPRAARTLFLVTTLNEWPTVVGGQSLAEMEG